MQAGRKVVMLATNAFGLGIDKPDIRYIIHYQMPGSPESYVQEAGRAGRDGKPARCVLLFQPDDIAIQEHFLKEAHPTKSQARMVAEGLYAWSDEGKEVSVRDLALSMALPERRVRVILSVLEAMGVAEEVKAARWKGVDPKPTREQIDKAAMVFEARRISDRRRLDSLLSYMNTQKCRVQMLRSYFGEPEGAQCGLCDSDAGLDSEVFDSGDADERHGLHAATDFHARPRRRRRGRGGGYEVPTGPSAQAQAHRPSHAPPPPPKFEFEIPGDVPPPLAPFEVPAPAESEESFDEALWVAADAGAGDHMPGDAVVDLSDHETGEAAAEGAPAPEGAATEQDFNAGWAAVRDANIRPYVEWREGVPVALPVLTARPQSGGGGGGHAGHHGHAFGHGGGGGERHPRGGGPGGRFDGGGGGGGGRRKRRRGKNRERDNNNRRDHHRHRDRDRGPRLPGVYNPGGD